MIAKNAKYSKLKIIILKTYKNVIVSAKLEKLKHNSQFDKTFDVLTFTFIITCIIGFTYSSINNENFIK